MIPEPLPGLVDTHCHLNFDDYDHDREFVIDNARKCGITRILIPGIDLETSQTAIKYASEYPEVYAAVGIHPNSALDWTDDSPDVLREMAKNKKVVAIGEIGLDYYRDRAPKDLQQQIFLKQLELAADLNLPVIIHNRNASEDIIKILKRWHLNLNEGVKELTNRPGVLHSFSGDVSLANELIAISFMIGINGPITFKNSKDLQEVVRALPVDKLLTETDAPFLTPHPYRGKRNEPANVRIVAEHISLLKGMLIDEVARITTAQSDMLFRWR